MPIGWWQQLIAAGGLKDLDVASVHPYTGNNDSFEEDGMPAQVRQLQGMLGGKPLWFTEVGWWSDGDYNFLNQANVVARAMIWQKVLGVPVWNYFFDEGNWGNDGVSFSLIQASSADDYVKPAALATMTTDPEMLAHRPYLSMPATGIPQTYEASFGATAGGTDQVAAALVGRTGPRPASVKVTAPGGGTDPGDRRPRSTATPPPCRPPRAPPTACPSPTRSPTSPIRSATPSPSAPPRTTEPTWPSGSAGATATASSGNAVGRHRRAARRLRPGMDAPAVGTAIPS